MNIEELFRGAGLVIDDRVFDKDPAGDRIVRIVSDLEKRGFLLVKYKEIPNVDALSLKKFSFILLDWELINVSDEEGNPMPGLDVLKKETKDSLIKFIKGIVGKCYLPVFIFSNSAEVEIRSELKENGIEIEQDNLPIFIKTKADIVEGNNVKVVEAIEKWLVGMPAVYVLKVWENAIEEAKTKTFKALAGTKSWPAVIWETAVDDKTDPEMELREVLTQNILGRMAPLSFDGGIVWRVDGKQCPKEEILKVLSAQRFEAKTSADDVSMTGDMYEIEGKYYLNIRPSCDCVVRDGADAEVYLIKGEKLSPKDLKGSFVPKYGNFTERSNEAIVGPLVDNKFFSFRFKDLCIKEYSEIRDKKIGRVLPPFIRHITERYALYIQRQGLPRIPTEAVE